VLQMLATLCVTPSLALIALGSSNLTDMFHLGTLSVGRTLGNHGSHFGYDCHSRDVEGAPYEELGWHVNLCLLHLFTAPAWAHCFASLVVTLWGYKAGGHSCTQPTSSCTIFHRLPASFPMQLKEERDRETCLEIRGVVDFIGCCISFPSRPFQSCVGPRRRSCKSTYKTS
jgi:hypothetical protein